MTLHNLEDEYGITHLFEHLPGYTVDNGRAQMVFDNYDDLVAWAGHLRRAVEFIEARQGRVYPHSEETVPEGVSVKTIGDHW